jgi:hypothetical protein
VGIFLTLGAGRGVAGDGGRGGVLGRGREGTEGKRGVGRLSALFIGAMAVRRGGVRGVARRDALKEGGWSRPAGGVPVAFLSTAALPWRSTVQTGDRRGPLMRGPRLVVGQRGRGEARDAWASPGEKREVGRARMNRKVFDLFK